MSRFRPDLFRKRDRFLRFFCFRFFDLFFYGCRLLHGRRFWSYRYFHGRNRLFSLFFRNGRRFRFCCSFFFFFLYRFRLRFCNRLFFFSHDRRRFRNHFRRWLLNRRPCRDRARSLPCCSNDERNKQRQHRCRISGHQEAKCGQHRQNYHDPAQIRLIRPF